MSEDFRLQLKYGMTIYLNEQGEDVPIIYSPCDCQEKYSFKPYSRLLNYLQQSKGWVDDVDGKYTLNFIIINLLKIAQVRGLLLYTETGVDYLKGVPELRSALGVRDVLINIRRIRPLIANAHLEGHRPVFGWYCQPFACTNKIGKRMRRFIYSILGKPDRDTKYISKTPWEDGSHEDLCNNSSALLCRDMSLLMSYE